MQKLIDEPEYFSLIMQNQDYRTHQIVVSRDNYVSGLRTQDIYTDQRDSTMLVTEQ
jgi:hypothetical protein